MRPFRFGGKWFPRMETLGYLGFKAITTPARSRAGWKSVGKFSTR